ncbi:response regulator transcription factor [Ructibacterium gallinarum]|uniref:Stage 0 sporulation protein A homolog n=1 Tax=Ructibacterium gallinarum TaxID=2779355 RepID=A0A9D5R7V9_9FIRM|nr:response regulator transcription factor [Ructibacterium gallinarum]MBE5039671.1 response regulator transcription factor [Ructibacterium gallinarum]
MIYLLEDDESIRELVIYTLNSQGLEAEGFSCPSDFWKAMKHKHPDLLLLDVMLPEEDGMMILKKLRRASDTESLPVIMLTAKNSEYDTVLGLDSGADDYISKPFRMMELLSRIRAVLRRTEKKKEYAEYQIGFLYVCPSRHIVEVKGEPISLTLKEFEILCLLMANQGVVITRSQLLDQVWGYAFDGESRTVDVHIRTLRQKLGDAGEYIETVRGIGYKMRR